MMQQNKRAKQKHNKIYVIWQYAHEETNMFPTYYEILGLQFFLVLLSSHL